MQPHLRARDKRLLLPVLVGLSILLMLLPAGVGNAASRVVGEAVGPFQKAVAGIARPVSNFFDGIFNAGRLRSENDRLREELKQLRAESEGKTGAAVRVEELEKLLNLQRTQSIKGIAARVVASRQTNFDQSVVIDAGRDSGILPSMPVVDADGLVGTVVEASSSSSRVRLLVEPKMGVGARLADSRDVGVVTGDGESTLSLRLIDPRVPVKPGEQVVTSGDAGGSVFPPDIPIGRVVSVEGAKSELEARIRVEPAVDFSRLEYVRVLIYTGPGGATGR